MHSASGVANIGTPEEGEQNQDDIEHRPRCQCTCNCEHRPATGNRYRCASHCEACVCQTCVANREPVICHWCMNPYINSEPCAKKMHIPVTRKVVDVALRVEDRNLEEEDLVQLPADGTLMHSAIGVAKIVFWWRHLA